MTPAEERSFLVQRCRDQERLLATYRSGSLRPPAAALDRLRAGRDLWEQLRPESK